MRYNLFEVNICYWTINTVEYQLSEDIEERGRHLKQDAPCNLIHAIPELYKQCIHRLPTKERQNHYAISLERHLDHNVNEYLSRL